MAKYGPSRRDNLYLGLFFVALLLLYKAGAWLWHWVVAHW